MRPRTGRPHRQPGGLPQGAGPAAAGTLWEALIEAHLDTTTNRWRLQFDDTGQAGAVELQAHLEALVGSVMARNRLTRAYGLTHPTPSLPLSSSKPHVRVGMGQATGTGSVTVHALFADFPTIQHTSEP